MNPDIAIRSVLALFALWIVIYYLWPDFRRDAFREDIFSIRDEMFMYAAEGNISFDDPAYTILRNRMNGILRHGHEFTLTRMALIMMTHGDAKPKELILWEAAMEKLPASVQDQMRDFNVRVAIFVLQHVVFYSFFRYIVVRPIMFFVKVHRVIESPAVASGVERLESETLEWEERRMVTAAA